MSVLTVILYEFGSFSLNVKECLLLRENQPVRLPPKTFELLLFFVQTSNQVIDKETLMQEVWRDTFVEEANLTNHISALRKILALDAEKKVYIETFPKRGYRFVADVVEITERESSANGVGNFSESTDDAQGKVLEKDRDELYPTMDRTDYTTNGSNLTYNPQTNGNHSKSQTLTAFSGQTKTLDATTISSPNNLVTEIKSRKFIVFTAGILLVTVLLGFAAYKFRDASSSVLLPFATAAKLNITRLVTLGKVSSITISPDGKYAAYITDSEDKRSIRLRQIATATDLEIVSTNENYLSDLSFTPDINHLYYIDAGKEECALFKVPLLGGSPTKITGKNDNVAAAISSSAEVSPDGQTIAFIRANDNSSFLQIANADGSDERTLIKFSEPNWIKSRTAAWSPDGKTIAYGLSTKNKGATHIKLFGVNVGDGSQTQLAVSDWSEISGIEWLSDGNLIVSGKEKSGLRYAPSQLWLITPNAQLVPLTTDVFGYSTVSVAANGNALITLQSKVLKNIWIVPENDASRATQVTFLGEVDGGVKWTPDGNLVFGSNSSGNVDIWTLNADGTNRKQLTSNQGTNTFASMTPDLRYIVFHSNRAASVQHIFRMNSDGSNQLQLTNGQREFHPSLSPDGKWVYYGENIRDSETVNICKISIDGGTPIVIGKSFGTIGIDVAPRSGLVAYVNQEDRRTGGSSKIIIISQDGGKPIKTLPLPPTAHGGFIKWTPDERAIAFNDSRNGGANVWAIALDGNGEAKALTNFTNEQTLNFHWSADGKKLVASRGSATTDAVLISEAK